MMRHVLLLSAIVSAWGYGQSLDDFVLIPANPTFQFTKSLDPHAKGQGEASPVVSAYYICRHPVTNAEYAEFVSETNHRSPSYWNGRSAPEGRERHPVLSISYKDVLAYCEWISARTPGWRFRPPTEAEWENAAKGATVGNYNAVIARKLLAEDPDRLVTYYKTQSTRYGEQDRLSDVISVSASGSVSGWVNHTDWTGFVYTDLFKSIADAGGNTMDWDAFPEGASDYGVLDLLGNSWDWTSSVIVAVNGAEKGQSVNAVRGGSWYATKASCALSYRGEGRAPNTCFSTVGFRLVAESDETLPPHAIQTFEIDDTGESGQLTVAPVLEGRHYILQTASTPSTNACDWSAVETIQAPADGSLLFSFNIQNEQRFWKVVMP